MKFLYVCSDSMKVIYTTCTYNHIARAFSLADSVSDYCPDTRFVIGLIDESGGDHKGNQQCEIIYAKALELPFLSEMRNKYSVLELNAALKPYFADHIFKNYTDLKELIYLDSDILLFSNLETIYEALAENSIILTPHSLSTIKRGYSFDDRSFLRAGIYNIGFYAVKRDETGLSFLTWWMDKLKDEGYIDSNKGMFAEQLWLNLVPIYFSDVHVLRHIGCNVAYWNLHEREISATQNGYVVNGELPLIFFHFSGASISCITDDNLSSHQDRFTFTNRPDVLPLFEKYIAKLTEYNFEQSSVYYSITGKYKTKSKLLIFIVENSRKVIKRLFYQR